MQAKTTREEKGRALYQSGAVEFSDGNLRGCCAFWVQGSKGQAYEVCFDPAYHVTECECEDYRRHEPQACKHIYAAMLLRDEMMEIERREEKMAAEREQEMALF